MRFYYALVDWTAKYFDLVLVDEASQMGIAEALMAAAFLREDGQFIAIGDHRQMPPIPAHTWDRESRRDLERISPHLSISEYLREPGTTRAALDESFRIPEEVADFLGRHVYAADGADFHSSNRQRLEINCDLRDESLPPPRVISCLIHAASRWQCHARNERSLSLPRAPYLTSCPQTWMTPSAAAYGNIYATKLKEAYYGKGRLTPMM